MVPRPDFTCPGFHLLPSAGVQTPLRFHFNAGGGARFSVSPVPGLPAHGTLDESHKDGQEKRKPQVSYSPHKGIMPRKELRIVGNPLRRSVARGFGGRDEPDSLGPRGSRPRQREWLTVRARQSARAALSPGWAARGKNC
jgi:hypothetical protein